MKKNSIYIIGVAIFALSALMALHPGIQAKMREIFIRDDQMVLSSIKGIFLPSGEEADIFKVRRNHEIFIEIYSHSSQKIIDSIEVGEMHDGHFQVNGQSSNLLLRDVDGDNQFEIVVPTYDKNLVAKLMVYKYDKDSNSYRYFQHN